MDVARALIYAALAMMPGFAIAIAANWFGSRMGQIVGLVIAALGAAVGLAFAAT
jgi:hypothetical protein